MATGLGISFGPLWWGRPFGGGGQKHRKPLTFGRFLVFCFLAPIYIVVFAVWLIWLPVELFIRFIIWLVTGGKR